MLRPYNFLGTSEEAGDVFAHLVFPVRPVVATLRAPVVEGVVDAFAGENVGEAIGGAAVFPLAGAGADVNVATGKLIVDPGIAEVGEVVDGIVEVKIVVVKTVHKIAQIVNAGHCEAALDDIGVFEQAVGGMVGTEGSAHGGDGDVLILAIVANEGHEFIAQVGVEYGLDIAAMKWMSGFVVKAVAIDGIDGEKLDAAPVYEVR